MSTNTHTDVIMEKLEKWVIKGHSNKRHNRFDVVYLHQAYYNGEKINQFYLDDDGNVYSGLRYADNWCVCKMTPSIRNGYPFINMTKDGHRKPYNIHRIVASTFHKLDENFVPEGISKESWDVVKRFPDVLKYIYDQALQVNHIDHNRGNYHPSNLEWTTPKQNQKAYQINRLKVAA